MEANNVIEIRPASTKVHTIDTELDQTKDNRIGQYLNHSPFIEANTNEVSLSHLKNDCIVPSFAGDNEKTISHFEFIDLTHRILKARMRAEYINPPEVRVSHVMSGRIPEAIHKPAKELLEHEKTIYYERLAFVIQIPTHIYEVNGHKHMLTVGGVRALNKENLFGKKTFEKFSIFIGYQSWVCSNLVINTDGLKEDVKVSNMKDLQDAIINLISRFKWEDPLTNLKELAKLKITEKQFAQLIGKARLYQFLPKEEKSNLPVLQFTDSQFNSIAKDYYADQYESFCRDQDGDINLYQVYNLFTSANKSSYIDNFLGRNVNALNFTNGLADIVKGRTNRHSWFIS